MPKIKLRHRTSLSVSEIKEKAERLINDGSEEFKDKISDDRKEWTENTLVFSFRVKGFSISGQVIVDDNLIIIEVKLPFAAGIFKGKIRDKLDEKAKELFP